MVPVAEAISKQVGISHPLRGFEIKEKLAERGGFYLPSFLQIYDSQGT
jgi:hypothetical protein